MVLVRTKNMNSSYTDNFEYEQNVGQVIKQYINIIILNIQCYK